MKLVQYKKQQLPGGNLRVTATHRDQMRRPVNVEIQLDLGENAIDSEVTLVEGEAAEVASMFFGFADIAWDMGWRPRGMLAALPQFVQGYKLPPAAR